MTDIKDNGEREYESYKSGESTPLSISAVSSFFKERMRDRDMAAAQLYASAAFLVEELGEVEGDWIELSFENADESKSPFDGEPCIVKGVDGLGEPFLFIMSWEFEYGINDSCFFAPGVGFISKIFTKYWRPIPKVWMGE